jgi:hypothetical protein
VHARAARAGMGRCAHRVVPWAEVGHGPRCHEGQGAAHRGAGGHVPGGRGAALPRAGGHAAGGQGAARRGAGATTQGSGAHVGKREWEGGREERGAHLGMQQSAITIHRITPRARRWERGGREGEGVAARETK